MNFSQRKKALMVLMMASAINARKMDYFLGFTWIPFVKKCARVDSRIIDRDFKVRE